MNFGLLEDRRFRITMYCTMLIISIILLPFFAQVIFFIVAFSNINSTYEILIFLIESFLLSVSFITIIFSFFFIKIRDRTMLFQRIFIGHLLLQALLVGITSVYLLIIVFDSDEGAVWFPTNFSLLIIDCITVLLFYTPIIFRSKNIPKTTGNTP